MRQFEQLPRIIEFDARNLCVKLDNYQESLNLMLGICASSWTITKNH